MENITRLSSRVVRVLGQNPGKFTLQGTNTYLVGSESPYILIDTGEGKDEYIPLVETTLRSLCPLSPSSPAHVSDIILSHWHHDHTEGLPGILGLLSRLWKEQRPNAPFVPPRLHKFPVSSVPNSPFTTNKLDELLRNLEKGSFTPSPTGSALHNLHDGQELPVSTNDGNSRGMRIVHTPGHTTDSICILIPVDPKEQKRVPYALYTADSVLGEGTAVFEDLSTYMSSLKSLVDLPRSVDPKLAFGELYPGHGPVVPEDKGVDLIEMYIKHRMEREHQVVAVLSQPAPDPPEGTGDEATSRNGRWTIWGIVVSIYAKTYPRNLWLPACHSIGQHLRKLEVEGRVRCTGGEGVQSQWELVKET